MRLLRTLATARDWSGREWASGTSEALLLFRCGRRDVGLLGAFAHRDLSPFYFVVGNKLKVSIRDLQWLSLSMKPPSQRKHHSSP